MKKTLLCAAVAATLLAPAGFAAEPVKPALETPAKPATPPVPAYLEALSAAGNELKDVFGTLRGNPIPHLDRLTTFQHTEATRAKLQASFGVSSLFQVKKLAPEPNKVSYAVTIPSNKFTDPKQVTVEWTPFDSRVDLDTAGRHMIWNGNWSSLMVRGADMTGVVSNMTMESDQRRVGADVWLGKGNFKIASIDVGSSLKGSMVLVENTALAVEVAQKGKLIDVAYDFGVGAVTAGGVQLDTIRFASRVSRLDVKLYESLIRKANEKDDAGMQPAQVLAQFQKEAPAVARSFAAHGTAYEIDDFSAVFKGNKAQASGKVSLAPGKPADFNTMAGVMQKVLVRFNVRVPLAMVSDVAAVMVRRDAQAKGQVMSDAAAAQAGQSVADAMVGQAVNNGMAKVENGMLVSAIDFKGGKLTLNGKAMALPKGPKAKPAPPVASAK